MIVRMHITRYEDVEVPDHIVDFLDFYVRNEFWLLKKVGDYASVRQFRTTPDRVIDLCGAVRAIFGVELAKSKEWVDAWRHARGYSF